MKLIAGGGIAGGTSTTTGTDFESVPVSTSMLVVPSLTAVTMPPTSTVTTASSFESNETGSVGGPVVPSLKARLTERSVVWPMAVRLTLGGETMMASATRSMTVITDWP